MTNAVVTRNNVRQLWHFSHAHSPRCSPSSWSRDFYFSNTFCFRHVDAGTQLNLPDFHLWANPHALMPTAAELHQQSHFQYVHLFTSSHICKTHIFDQVQLGGAFSILRSYKNKNKKSEIQYSKVPKCTSVYWSIFTHDKVRIKATLFIRIRIIPDED